MHMHTHRYISTRVYLDISECFTVNAHLERVHELAHRASVGETLDSFLFLLLTPSVFAWLVCT